MTPATLACVAVLACGSVHAYADETLARAWCASCHAFPQPDLLDRNTWIENVLPDMGRRLGFIRQPDGKYVLATPEDEDLLHEWHRIADWFTAQAPQRLPTPLNTATPGLPLFDLRQPDQTDTPELPVTTALYIDETSHRLLVGNGTRLGLQSYSADLAFQQEVRLGDAISRISSVEDDTYLVTIMGALGPMADPVGTVATLNPDDPATLHHVARRLNRPVDAKVGDYNHDGYTDYLAAEFGTETGGLSLYLGSPDGRTSETVLINEPGITAVHVVGNDLIVLIAQANERIIRLSDFATASPTEQVLVGFPPSYGSSSLSLADFNHDGLPDLLYTAGDNADMSPILKPYHGVYLYLSQTDGPYTEALFFPLDGAYGAVAEDFDADGDLDIAAIAYFADFERNPETSGFVYLDNQNGTFSARTIEGITGLGRFATISAGDLDGDGDTDIVLGNLSYGATGGFTVPADLQRNWGQAPPFILLDNTLKETSQ